MLKTMDAVRYSLSLDHDLPLMDRVRAGRYEYVDPYVNAANFPTLAKGKVDIAALVVRLGSIMTTEEVHALHRELGVRPATIHELLAFGEAYPDVQKEHPVVAFGSSCIEQEYPVSVPALRSRDGRRELYLDWTGYRWSDQCGILVVPTGAR